MIQYFIVVGFFLLAFFLMGLALHFSKYKKRNSGCCGGGHCSNEEEGKVQSCYGEKVEAVKKFESKTL